MRLLIKSISGSDSSLNEQFELNGLYIKEILASSVEVFIQNGMFVCNIPNKLHQNLNHLENGKKTSKVLLRKCC